MGILDGMKIHIELLVEFIGTFMFTYAFATYTTGAQAITSGMTLMVLIYLFSEISGASFNPAVTMTQFFIGKLGAGNKDWKRLLTYFGVQFGAAILAAILGYSTRPADNIVACIGKGKFYNIVEAFMNEYVWSTLICFVVLVTQYTPEVSDMHHRVFPYCIGMSYTAAQISGVISGGGYNPALAFGLWFSSTFNKPSGNSCAEDGWGYMWYFLLAPIAGAATAWILHRTIHEERFERFSDLMMEFVGTFFLCFAMCVEIVGSNFFAVGNLVAVLTYVGWHKKSSHYNPVITLAVFLNGGISAAKFGFYALAQCCGAFAAAIVGYLITRYGSTDGQDFIRGGGSPLIPYHPAVIATENKFGGLLAEFFFTWFITVVYLAVVARVRKTGVQANPFFGIIIGWAVLAGYGTVGQFTKSIFNPAIWMGSSLVYLFSEGGDDVGEIYIYAISGFGGSVAGAFFYKFAFGNPYEGDAFDSPEGKALREREDMRTIAEQRKTGGGAGGAGKAGGASAGAGGAAGAGSGSVMTTNPMSGATAPAVTDGKLPDNSV